MSNVIRIEDSFGNIIDSLGGGGTGSSYNGVIDYWESEGKGIEEFTYETPCTGIAIVNLGVEDILITIGDLSFTVSSGEAFEDSFKPFTEMTIVANDAYKAIVRGSMSMVSEGTSSGGGVQISDAIVSPLMTWSSKKIDDTKANKNHQHEIDDVNGLSSKIVEIESSIQDSKKPHTHLISDITGLQDEIDSKSDKIHQHDINSIVGLQQELDDKVSKNKVYNISEIEGVQSELDKKSNIDHIHSANEINDLTEFVEGFTNQKANISHTHSITQVSGLQAELNNKINLDDEIKIEQIEGLVDTLQDLNSKLGNTGEHSHSISEVDGLQGELDKKSDVLHSHTLEEITGLQEGLDEKANVNHTQSISSIVNLTEQLSSKATAIHTHAIEDVSGLVTSLDSKSDKNHVHTIEDIVGLKTELEGIVAGSSTLHTHEIEQVNGLQLALDNLQNAIDSISNGTVINIANVSGLEDTIVNIENDNTQLQQKIVELEAKTETMDAGTF